MPVAYQLTIRRDTPVERTARVLQMEGLFDVPPVRQSSLSWDVRLDLPDQWNVGLIVGPSGCGKTTIAREIWPDRMASAWDWPENRSILDGFPEGLGIKEITGLLCSVGFSSPPAWLRPYRCLSNGEQFRVFLARTLAELPDLAVIDEFTSVVDRTVARIASAAVSKSVRRSGRKLVAVTCHYDVAEWLEPDWVYQPHTGEFVAGRLLRRPAIQLEVRRVHRSAWTVFKQHHYLSSEISVCAQCFVAFWRGTPVAFASCIPFCGRVSGYREHRTVCLPDYQGVGIGNALSEHIAAAYRAMGKPYYSATGNPAMIRHRARSPLWRMHRGPGIQRDCRGMHKGKPSLRKRRAIDRVTAGFEFVGPANYRAAKDLGII